MGGACIANSARTRTQGRSRRFGPADRGELAFATRKLEALASDLADDPAVVIRHAAQLQDLDITTQVLGHLTRLLGSEQPESLLAAIGMEDLRRRLERVSLG